jgi:predicted GIY-YIG superfamily endonuclease
LYWIRSKEHTDMFTQGYIGYSSNVKSRWNKHRSLVNLNKHDNYKLTKQIKNNKDLVWEVVSEHPTPNNALQYEKLLRPHKNIGWNIIPGGDLPPSNLGKKASAETKAKLSNSRKGTLSNKFKGFFITPFGKFPSAQLAADVMGCNRSWVRKCTFGFKIKGKFHPPKEGYYFEPK